MPNHWENFKSHLWMSEKNWEMSIQKIYCVWQQQSSEINAGLFPGKNFFNCNIPGGSISDCVGLYNLYKKNKMLPKYLFINIDPWSFHARKPIVSNKKIKYVSDSTLNILPVSDMVSEFNAGSKLLNLHSEKIIQHDNDYVKKLFEMLSLNYLQLNIASLNSNPIFKTKDSIVNSYFIIRSDGSYSLAEQKNIDSNKVIKQSKDFIALQKHNFFIAGDTAGVYFSYFKKLVIQLKKDGIVPIIYISPINPICYRQFADSGGVPLENSIASFCNKNNILVIGSFNPSKYGFTYTENFFIDEYHPVRKVVETIFKFHKKQLDQVIK